MNVTLLHNMIKKHPIETISAKNLSYQRGFQPILQNVSFTLHFGEILQVFGKNGSGKTTLLRILAGLLDNVENPIQINGQALPKKNTNLIQHSCYIGHKNAIKNYLTVVENIQCDSLLWGQCLSTLQVAEIAKAFRMQQYLDRIANELSFGQQKKLALLKLFITTAQCWLLDEPFIGLDQASQDILSALIKQHSANGGIVILTSHQTIGRLPTGSIVSLYL